MGAVICNGNLYCPATPHALFELSPLAPGASEQQAAAHARRCDELHRYKLSAITAYDKDGYRRVACPAVRGKPRCPLRAASMELSHERPTVCSAPPSTRRSAAPNRRSPCRRPWQQRPSRSTTTPPPSTDAPTRGAQRPSEPSRASSTQPPSTSQEAGVASWGSRRRALPRARLRRFQHPRDGRLRGAQSRGREATRIRAPAATPQTAPAHASRPGDSDGQRTAEIASRGPQPNHERKHRELRSKRRDRHAPPSARPATIP